MAGTLHPLQTPVLVVLLPVVYGASVQTAQHDSSRSVPLNTYAFFECVSPFAFFECELVCAPPRNICEVCLVFKHARAEPGVYLYGTLYCTLEITQDCSAGTTLRLSSCRSPAASRGTW